jgi:hypothetical protein
MCCRQDPEHQLREINHRFTDCSECRTSITAAPADPLVTANPGLEITQEIPQVTLFSEEVSTRFQSLTWRIIDFL